ncbi:conserved hypothetical protein [[Clostridium] ultunense Esp]|uniref:HTH-type transcriptional regulatory protein TyrR n=1 Tax=[Clostridium] ultunense Esp TaxID=1288971 RepID=M1ZG76_9FIRM|nr:sigma-54 dependent transcriptional regulator [Schnuerera ultunensis]CCQ97223.1 conserved hypothetical protein [[Clostridium] ultunense Esp]SHD75693.1 conserved protein of unknown function [[Clostridium] ultunense Esp]
MEDYNYKNNIDKHGSIIPPKDFSQFETGNIVTINKNMLNLLNLCIRVAKTNAPIIVYGESGVGKEMVAELIHQNSNRTNQPFVKLNCSAIPENLLESEFFGYEPGAFTGALKTGKQGIIELANKGTLLLDEIGEMPVNLQPKLLRFLQNGKYTKVGGYEELFSDVRVISATNKSLEHRIDAGLFREDLYFRLNVIPINIPPLRKRKEDIPILALYFLDYYNQYYNMDKKVSVKVMENLIDYEWPGNVRELKNVIERLALISLDKTITEEDLTYSSFATKKYNTIEKKNYEQSYEFDEKLSLKEIVANYEIKVILNSVKRYGSIRKAARVLQVSPSTLSRKISTYFENNKD